MAGIWSQPAAEPAPKDNADVADTGLADVGLPSPSPQPELPAGRPQLQRDQPQPPPPHQPPPPPAPQQVGNPTDSLSLMQLKRIITEFPRAEPIAYAFEYSDTASYAEEIDEWFSYNDAEFTRLRNARESFGRQWSKASGHKDGWKFSESSEDRRKDFVKQEITAIRSDDLEQRCRGLRSILHIILGNWDESAGRNRSFRVERTSAAPRHITEMKFGLRTFAECDGIPAICEGVAKAFDRLCDDDYRNNQIAEEDIPMVQEELDNFMTITYVAMEGARTYQKDLPFARKAFVEAKSLDFLTNLIARLRWDETNELPQTRIFLLFWKNLLLLFGGTQDLAQVKNAINETSLEKGEDASGLITASPLDYHLFRQEITSKYPAYVPPRPLIPLENDNNSILPPLPNHSSRNNGSNGILPPPVNINAGGASILHQPVHIATPAPSPPPSPPVGGKAGKKQNYQTNQNFPFMYPPLDSTSNSAGGKGAAGLQELLVGRKWEGSEIPASILEAGSLFAKRMRMTRAMRQLWDERERFMKFERGWDGDSDGELENMDVDDLDLEALLTSRLEKLEAEEDRKTTQPKPDYGPRGVPSANVKERLDAVEEFYVSP
jgi:hypothetical protein